MDFDIKCSWVIFFIAGLMGVYYAMVTFEPKKAWLITLMGLVGLQIIILLKDILQEKLERK